MRRMTVGILAVLLLGSVTAVRAESPFDPKGSVRDNLSLLHGAKKSVVVVLKSGQSYTAKLGAVGDRVVVLTEPQGKELFDILIPIEEIAAVEARARP